MARFGDALRGYAFPIHQRDAFKCVYCGLDGSASFAAWLSLSWDHLLPKGHPSRDDPRYIVTACQFCNVADNQYFAQAIKRGLSFDGKTPEHLVAQRRTYVMKTRNDYLKFWESTVRHGRGAGT